MLKSMRYFLTQKAKMLVDLIAHQT